MIFTFCDKSYIELKKDNSSTTVGNIAHEIRNMTDEVLRENRIEDSYKSRLTFFKQFELEVSKLLKSEVKKLIK